MSYIIEAVGISLTVELGYKYSVEAFSTKSCILCYTDTRLFYRRLLATESDPEYNRGVS